MKYYQYAEKSLNSFSPMAKGAGFYAGYLFNAYDEYFNTLKLTLNTDPKSDLSKEALSGFYSYKGIVYRKAKDIVLPCKRVTYYESIYTPEHIRGGFLKIGGNHG